MDVQVTSCHSDTSDPEIVKTVQGMLTHRAKKSIGQAARKVVSFLTVYELCLRSSLDGVFGSNITVKTICPMPATSVWSLLRYCWLGMTDWPDFKKISVDL